MHIEQDRIPLKKEVQNVCDMLGINPYELACEGRFICVVDPEDEGEVVSNLRKYNELAATIGEITDGDKVVEQTFLGKRIMNWPSGRIIPRIC